MLNGLCAEAEFSVARIHTPTRELVAYFVFNRAQIHSERRRDDAINAIERHTDGAHTCTQRKDARRAFKIYIGESLHRFGYTNS